VQKNMETMPLVLIVDDNPAGRKALESLLIDQGYRLYMASNGEEALLLGEKLKPDIILLDVMMPGINGFEVCRRLRAQNGLAEVPIVMVTALDDSEARLTGIEAGADDFISKPFDRAELRARIRTITRLNRYHSLLEEREKLRSLTQQMLDLQEGEKRALAIELHDEIGQDLTGLKHLVRHARDCDSSSEADDKLNIALSTISSLIDKVRNLALNLRPSMLDDFGLYAALSWLVTQYADGNEIEITTNIKGFLDRRFSPAIETTIFRIAQESLTNIIRHSHAVHASLTLEEKDSKLVLQVRDDGQGFDLSTMLAPKQYSTGLSGMQERARMVGGKINIDSAHNRGTVITVTIPLREEGQA
jgi:signal transduction histidine kinase